jgi:exosortase/archaeosortase family protein
LLASPLAAIFCNVVRVIVTIWMYGYMPDYAMQFHTWAGWAMLGLAFGMLYGLIKTLQWALIPVNEYTLASQ